MFRRNENEPAFEPPRSTTPSSTPSSSSSMNPVRTETAVRTSTIGASLHVKGEITGAEDLSVDGIVEGGINLKQNTVTIGKSGRVQASIYAKVIHVEGEVTGDLFATEAVIVHRTGTVRGNINSPRVTLEDGARLKGSIDTEVASVEVKLSSADIPTKAAADSKNNNKKTETQPGSTQGAAMQ